MVHAESDALVHSLKWGMDSDIWRSDSLCCFWSSVTRFREEQGSKEGCTYCFMFLLIKLELHETCKGCCYHQIRLISGFMCESAGAVNH